MLPGDLVPVLTLEGEDTGSRLEQCDAERIDVGPPVEHLSARLLGREVLRRADHHVGAGLLDVAAHGARYPEVGHHGIAVLIEENVVGLDVAVDHPFAVSEGERGGDVHSHPDEQMLRERPHRLEPVVEDAGEIVHDEIDGLVLAPHGEDADDVRVAELRRHGCLAPEARLERFLSRELGLEDLDGYRNIEFRIVALVDPGEAA